MDDARSCQGTLEIHKLSHKAASLSILRRNEAHDLQLLNPPYSQYNAAIHTVMVQPFRTVVSFLENTGLRGVYLIRSPNLGNYMKAPNHARQINYL